MAKETARTARSGMTLCRMRAHPSQVVAEALKLLAGDFVEAIPGSLERSDIETKDLAQVLIAGPPPELALVVAIALAGVNGNEPAGVQESESAEIQSA